MRLVMLQRGIEHFSEDSGWNHLALQYDVLLPDGKPMPI